MRTTTFSYCGIFMTALILISTAASSIVTAAAAVPNTITTNDDCIGSKKPIWKETIGNVEEYPYDALEGTNEEAIRIVSQNGDSVSFSVNQFWMKEGTPMMAVHYRSISDEGGEEICDKTITRGGTNVIEYGTTKEYTAECIHGYADVSVYIYVGPHDDNFDVDECESCAAPDNNYVGYYMSLSCVPVICDTTNPTSSPTNGFFEVLEATPTSAPSFDCIEYSKPILKQVAGGATDDEEFFDTVAPPVVITSQNIDEVTVTVGQVFNQNGIPMMAVGYMESDTGQYRCESETSNVQYNFGMELTAQCVMGYADLVLYLYVGPESDYDVEECEACSLPPNANENENYVALYFAVPCTPVCAPEIDTDCYDGPIIVLADVEHERDVCLYDNTPIKINEESMNVNDVEFYIDNTWPTKSNISSVSVSYKEPNSGELRCDRFENINNNEGNSDPFVKSGLVKSLCKDGVTTVIVEIHSSKIEYQADQLAPNSCEPIAAMGTCAYEFVLPCDPSLECGHNDVRPTTSPTGFPTSYPTFHPTDFPSNDPTQSPSDEPTKQPSNRPSSVPSDKPSSSPTNDPTTSPSSSPTTPSPSSSPSEAPSGSYFPSSSPSESPTKSPAPSSHPSSTPSDAPTELPTEFPTLHPTFHPTGFPSNEPTQTPSSSPSTSPSAKPSNKPSGSPSGSPSESPSDVPSSSPTERPSSGPSSNPTVLPSSSPSASPSISPSGLPSASPSGSPSVSPSGSPSVSPSSSPSGSPSVSPSTSPTASPSVAPSYSPTTSNAPTFLLPDCYDGPKLIQKDSSDVAMCAYDPDLVQIDAMMNNDDNSVTVTVNDVWTDVGVVVPNEIQVFVHTNGIDSILRKNGDGDGFQCLNNDGTDINVVANNNNNTMNIQCYQESTNDPFFAVIDVVITDPIICGTNEVGHPCYPNYEPVLESCSWRVLIPCESDQLCTDEPSNSPSVLPSISPSSSPSTTPSSIPSDSPSGSPSSSPSGAPSSIPSDSPSASPSSSPSVTPSSSPTSKPSVSPSASPSGLPSGSPSVSPSASPSVSPSSSPSASPSVSPSASPTASPSVAPSDSPTTSSAPTFLLPDCYDGPKLIQKDSSDVDMCVYDPELVQIDAMNHNNVTVSINDVWTDVGVVVPNEIQVFVHTNGVDSVRRSNDGDGFQCLDNDGTDIDFANNNNELNIQCYQESTNDPFLAVIDVVITDPIICGTNEVGHPCYPNYEPVLESCSWRVVIPCGSDQLCTEEPSSSPSALPSSSPSERPSTSPSSRPSDSPSSSPSSSPSVTPSSAPSDSPSDSPSSSPSVSPSLSPSVSPSASPSAVPSDGPSLTPTTAPSSVPTASPSAAPSSEPSASPSSAPSSVPSSSPSDAPSTSPSENPSGSFFPSSAPSDGPTVSPQPSSQPSSKPSESPSEPPSANPSQSPSRTPSSVPSDGPSLYPTNSPSGVPTKTPSAEPSASPSGSPSKSPSASPSESPSASPSKSPSASPSKSPSGSPSESPSKSPSASPSESPSESPSASPSNVPSTAPSESPSGSPTEGPTNKPSAEPTHSPSAAPSAVPSDGPSLYPTKAPSNAPTKTPSLEPSQSPSSSPSAIPSDSPSDAPSNTPSADPTHSPSVEPSESPSSSPSAVPSDSPSDAPTNTPSADPTHSPSVEPSQSPSSLPSAVPSDSPSDAPTNTPSMDPTDSPSAVPSSSPSVSPSSLPSASPSSRPTGFPTSAPSSNPSTAPSSAPNASPSAVPSDGPSLYPSNAPSSTPSYGSTSSATQNQCPPSDPILIDNGGETMYRDLPIAITFQNTTHVAFSVENTFGTTVSSIFTQYHSGSFGEAECLEEENVEQRSKVETEFLAQCMHQVEISIINVWITDCNNAVPFLDQTDDAEVPECCHPGEQCRTVQYTFKLPCVSPCPDDDEVSVLPITDPPIIAPVLDPVPPPVNGGQFGQPNDYSTGNEGGARRNLATEKNNAKGSAGDFETLTGHSEHDDSDNHFCVVEDYPCGTNKDKVHVCHYSSRDGYKTYCVPPHDSDVLRFYPKDYCGPCVGFYSTS